MSVPVPPRPGLKRRPFTFHLSLPRRPVVFWSAALALALCTAVVVGRLVGEAQAERARYGNLIATVVATRHLSAGEILSPEMTEIRMVPSAFRPAGAIDHSVGMERVTSAINAGEPVHPGRLAGGSLSATAALLPPATLGIAIPYGVAHLPLEVGDVVDLLATVDPSIQNGEAAPTFPVATGATVVNVGEQAVTIAVTQAEAPRVAFATSIGLVTILLSASR